MNVFEQSRVLLINARLEVYVQTRHLVASAISGIGIWVPLAPTVKAGSACSASSISRYFVPCVATARVPPQWKNKTCHPRGAAAEICWETPPQPVDVLVPDPWNDPRRDPSPFPASGGEYPCSAKTHTLTTKYPDSTTVWPELRRESKHRRELQALADALSSLSLRTVLGVLKHAARLPRPRTAARQPGRTRLSPHPNGGRKRAGNAPRLEQRTRGIRLPRRKRSERTAQSNTQK